MSRRSKNIRRSNEFYSQAVKIFRSGFAEYVPVIDNEGNSVQVRIKDTRTGRYIKDRKTGEFKTKDKMNAVHPQGKFADGFEASDGYNLREIGQWSPAQKAKVTKMFTAIDELSARPYKVVKPRRKDRLKRLQAAAQHHRVPKGLKVAFVPIADATAEIKIKYTKKVITITERGIVQQIIPLDPVQLLLDPEIAVNEAIKKHPAKIYTIQAGKYEISDSLRADEVAEAVMKRQKKYNKDEYDPDDPNSRYWGNWLEGIKGYDYDKRVDLIKFRKARKKSRMSLKKNRAAQKRKIKKMIKVRHKENDNLH